MAASSSGADVDSSVLHRALDAARTDDVDALAECFAECPAVLNAADSGNYTVCKAAAADGSLGCIKFAIKHGADLNANPGGTRTALMAAAGTAKLRCIEALLEAGADANVVLPETGSTALMMASRIGAKLCVDALLRGGARSNAADANGWTALRFAAEMGPRAASTVRVLLSHGADPGAVAGDGKSPLDVASASGDEALWRPMREFVAAGERLAARGGATAKAAEAAARFEAEAEGRAGDDIAGRAARIAAEWEAAGAGGVATGEA